MDWKKAGKHIFFPHPAVLFLLLPTSVTLLTYSLLLLESTDAVSIISYVLSFYVLTAIALRVPDFIRFIQRFRQENPYIVRYCSDVQLRVNISLLGSLAFNVIYAAFQLGLGLWHHSVWFYAMAGYYLLLALMRLLLIQYTKNHVPGAQRELEWKKYRLCGVLLMLMTLVLAIFVIYFVWNIRTFRHHEITTISMAAYTFGALTMAIINAVRYKSYHSPAYSAAKAISLVSAIVSMLTLENAMLTTFGQENSEFFRQAMLGISGLVVVLSVQGIALYMIIHAGRKLRT